MFFERQFEILAHHSKFQLLINHKQQLKVLDIFRSILTLLLNYRHIYFTRLIRSLNIIRRGCT